MSVTSEFEATTVFPDARFARVGPQRETLRLFPRSPAYFAAQSPADVTGVPPLSASYVS